jgi:hypothetical protein
MNKLDKRIDAMPSVLNNRRVALAINGTHAIAHAASGAGWHASHCQLILP